MRGKLVRGGMWCLFALVCLSGIRAIADSEYFPPRTFVEDPPSGLQDISERLSKDYSEALRTMKEPSLWKLAQQDKQIAVYRLLKLPTWGRPIAVRIEKAGGRVTLNEVLLDGDGGYDLGEVVVSKQVALSERDWDRLMRHVEGVGFWDMPTSINDLGVDGEHLIVEGVKDGKFHVVDRWEPKPGAYRELCRSMLNLAGLPLGGKAWPAPESPSLTWVWLTVILGVALSACVIHVVFMRGHRRGKPPSPGGLDEFA
jgi:hypothetical protein